MEATRPRDLCQQCARTSNSSGFYEYNYKSCWHVAPRARSPPPVAVRTTRPAAVRAGRPPARGGARGGGL